MDAPLFAPPDIDLERRPDGTLVLSSRKALGRYWPSLGVPLRRWAVERGDDPFLAERAGDGRWRTVTYRMASTHADAIGQALLDRGLGPQRPVMILSGNGIDHALLMLGCFVSGVPVAPLSVAYSL